MPFLVNFKICLHADEKPYCIEEACSNTRVRADKVSSNQALLLTVFRLVDLVMCAQCLTPACSAVPLQRTWRHFVLRLQNATNQTALIAPHATASGFSKHAKCKEPYCVHSPTSDKDLSATLWDAGRLCPKMSTSKKTNNEWMNRLDDSVHSFETFQSGRTSRWTNTERPRSGAAVAALNVISEHLMGSSLDGSTCHWPQFCPRKSGTGWIYCGIELKKIEQKKARRPIPALCNSPHLLQNY